VRNKAASTEDERITSRRGFILALAGVLCKGCLWESSWCGDGPRWVESSWRRGVSGLCSQRKCKERLASPNSVGDDEEVGVAGSHGRALIGESWLSKGRGPDRPPDIAVPTDGTTGNFQFRPIVQATTLAADGRNRPHIEAAVRRDIDVSPLRNPREAR